MALMNVQIRIKSIRNLEYDEDAEYMVVVSYEDVIIKQNGKSSLIQLNP
jgi:hypothetical protein